jgi:hypothetical protein
MNKTENKIIMWEKWRDPFGEKDDNDIDEEPYSNFYNDDEEDDEKDDINEFDTILNNFGKKQIKVIATPMGIIPVNENTASGKLFNFWIGHTNFDITRKISETIEQINGVECLDIFTRYRFRVAIGKAFYDSEVKKNIQDTVYEIVQNDENK